MICFIVKENASSFFFLNRYLWKYVIRFKITINLVIKQNIFEFSSESRVHENEHSTGKSSVCFLVYRDKVTYIQAQENFRRKYGRKPPARPTIRARDKKFMKTAAVDMLARTWQKIEYWLDIVRATDDAHAEVY